MNRTKLVKIRHSLYLLLAAVIWGAAFVAQSAGMDYVDPLTFNAARFLLGGVVLIPFMLLRNRSGAKTWKQTDPVEKRTTLTGGLCCGAAICSASLFQQYGIIYTTVGKAGFITTLYIIIIPVMGIFMKKKIKKEVWFAVAAAAAGLYLLCVNGSFSINKGDILILICAVLFSFHMLIIEYFSPKADGVRMSCIQFLFSGFICTIAALFLEKPDAAGLLAGWLPILYAGILSCGVAYTLQIVGQKGVDAATASLILSLESVVSVLAGWIILGQSLSPKEISGCVLVFAAVIYVQKKAT